MRLRRRLVAPMVVLVALGLASVDVITYQAVTNSEDVGVVFTHSATAPAGNDVQKALDAAIDAEAVDFSGAVSSRVTATVGDHPADVLALGMLARPFELGAPAADEVAEGAQRCVAREVVPHGGEPGHELVVQEDVVFADDRPVLRR